MVRNKNMSMRLYEEELDLINRAAKEVGLPATTWMRKLVLDTSKEICAKSARTESVDPGELAFIQHPLKGCPGKVKKIYKNK